MINNNEPETAVQEQQTEVLHDAYSAVDNQVQIPEIPVKEKEKLPQSPYSGVSYFKISKKWAAKVLLNPDESGKRKLKHVGYFENDRDAAIARNKYIDDHNLVCKKSKVD